MNTENTEEKIAGKTEWNLLKCDRMAPFELSRIRHVGVSDNAGV